MTPSPLQKNGLFVNISLPDFSHPPPSPNNGRRFKQGVNTAFLTGSLLEPERTSTVLSTYCADTGEVGCCRGLCIVSMVTNGVYGKFSEQHNFTM